MAVHARLKNKFKVDEKYHNLMTWLIYVFPNRENYPFIDQSSDRNYAARSDFSY